MTKTFWEDLVDSFDDEEVDPLEESECAWADRVPHLSEEEDAPADVEGF